MKSMRSAAKKGPVIPVLALLHNDRSGDQMSARREVSLKVGGLEIFAFDSSDGHHASSQLAVERATGNARFTSEDSFA
jgi:hypothetical protein